MFRIIIKFTLIQSNAHRDHYDPTGRVRAKNGVKHMQFILLLFSVHLNV